VLGPENPSTLQTLHNLGLFYHKEHKWVEAEHVYLKALEGIESTLRPGHPETLDTVYNIGLLYSDQGRFEDAESMLRCPLKGFKGVVGLEGIQELDTMYNLGLVCIGRRRWRRQKLAISWLWKDILLHLDQKALPHCSPKRALDSFRTFKDVSPKLRSSASKR
jgi:tetratricopeptide (TPR) repeat protein